MRAIQVTAVAAAMVLALCEGPPAWAQQTLQGFATDHNGAVLRPPSQVTIVGAQDGQLPSPVPAPQLSGSFGPVPDSTPIPATRSLAITDAMPAPGTGPVTPGVAFPCAGQGPPTGPGVCGSASRGIRRDGAPCSDCRYRLHACWLGFSDQWIAPPLGASVYAFGTAMVANADAARMVLYHFDFIDGTDQLNPRGRAQLGVIAALLSKTSFPLVIEPMPWVPGLDEARRIAVMNELTHCAVPVAFERIIVADPIALGLRGREAEIIYQNLTIQTQSGGAQAGAGGGSIGGTVGQGFNAPGR